MKFNRNTKEDKGLEYWLLHYGMPEDNIEKCITQIAEGYGACRYLDGVKDGAEAVCEQEHTSITAEQFMNMKIEKEVIQEWKRYMESDEFNHDPECGTLMIAQHFAEWGRVNPKQENE